jgi:hypothetical protein
MAEENPVIALPEGRLINHSLFVKDQFNEAATPSYKIEMAFPRGTLDEFNDLLLDAAVEKWGAGADEDEDLVIPIKDGDKLQKKREAKGKEGDAYADMDVVRASTHFNRHGEDDVGGIACYAPDVSEIGPANQSEIYQGCFGIVGVTVGTYIDNDGNNAITLYLSAFQKTKDGDRLASQRDMSKLFKPVGRKTKAKDTGGEESDGEEKPKRSRRKG